MHTLLSMLVAGFPKLAEGGHNAVRDYGVNGHRSEDGEHSRG